MPLPWCYATHMGWVFECCVFLLLILPLETFYELCSNFSHANDRPLCLYAAGAMPATLYPITHSQSLQKGGKSSHCNVRKQNCLDALLLPWCYATHDCWVFECCVLLRLSLPLETFSALYEFSSNYSYAIVKPLCVYGAAAMLAPPYPSTHLHWLQKGGKSRYSNDTSIIPFKAVLLPWCYATHVCWVYRVLCFPASRSTSRDILRDLQQFFAQNCEASLSLRYRSHACDLVPHHTLAVVAEGWKITLFQ